MKAGGSPSAAEAITTYREELDVTDQYLPPFIVEKDGQPAGRIVDGGTAWYCSTSGATGPIGMVRMAFEYEDFDKFDRRYAVEIVFAGMLKLRRSSCARKVPGVASPSLRNTLSELLVETRHAVCRIRDPEVRPHDILLERQQERQVQR